MTIGFSTGKSRTLAQNRANLILIERQRQIHCATDPYEQAKLYLGRKGYPVYRRSVKGLDGIQVGRHIMANEAEVIEYARRLGWSG